MHSWTYNPSGTRAPAKIRELLMTTILGTLIIATVACSEPNPTATVPPAATDTLISTKPQVNLQGLTIAPEERCSPYFPEDYRYPQSVEPKIVAQMDGIYGPYTGTWFDSTRQTDIEHIVARS